MNGIEMSYIAKLPEPEQLREQYPLKKDLAEVKRKNDLVVKNILSGNDRRLLLIIGPCSADREDAIIEYMYRLRRIQEIVIDQVFIIPRLYTNKPRTTGIGYKGLLHQPDPTKESDLLKGIISVRKMNLMVMQETGFSCADEMLYPENQLFISDLLSYVAVGARSVEDQQHRMVASGLGIPVGMKNPTSGNLNIMLNSIIAAQSKQTFIFRNWEVSTQGNPMAHAILRGYENKFGKLMPNYHYEDLQLLLSLYYDRNIPNPVAIIDCNHANSNKHFMEQIRISNDIINSRKNSQDICRFVKGLMIESYLEDGNQTQFGTVFGKSITDACLGWEKTEKLIYNLADNWE